MKYISKRQLHEVFIYAVLWLVVFVTPALDMYLKASETTLVTFSWTDVYRMWSNILPFFILFIVHNFILFPRLLLGRKTAAYIVSLICALVVFHLTQRYDWWGGAPHPRISQKKEKHWMPHTSGGGNTTSFDRPEIIPESSHKEHPFPMGPDKMPFPRLGPSIFVYPYFIGLLIAILMLGVNIAVKLLFKSQHDEEVMRELERQHLRQELEYLKYQINPHFFMNTLNNIHALVDIDTEKAKDTLLELSRLMRYVLYEGSDRTVLLSSEIAFLQHYVALMRLRYTDKVSIDVDMPARIPEEVQIPPLLFISFVENAFKHGVSYQSVSFIRLIVKLEGNEVFFRCTNSRHVKNNRAQNENPHSGIGLENVRKRLKLLYGNGYYLNIDDKPDLFDVLLVIPITI